MARRQHPASDLSAYIDGELGRLGRRRVRRHLAECEPCRRFVEQLTGTRRAMRTVPLERLSRNQRAELALVYERWLSERTARNE